MSLRKVYGGTPVGNESPCNSCANAQIIQGYSESERIVFCDATHPTIRVPFSVRQCSMYEDKRLPDVEDLEEIAWPLISKSAGHRAGFVLVSQAQVQSQQDEDGLQEIPAAASAKE
jgi:hypothetical protein